MEAIMFEKNLLLRSLLAAGLTTGLVACGGGGSSSTGGTDPDTQTETGRFVDSAVTGLEYDAQPSGLNGLTNGNGEFQYRDGDSVTFSVGNYRVGEASGAKLVTPVEIAAQDEAKTANIARFLQTLDEDDIADNGISISGSSRTKAALANPSDVAIINFGDATIASAVLDLTADNPVPKTEIVDEQEAVAHLNNTLQSENPINQCGTDTETLTSEKIAGKTFGFIESDEVAIFSFDADTVTEFHQDDAKNGELTDGETSAWSVNGGSITLFDETFAACATDAYLIFETADKPVKMYELEPYSLPKTGTSQTFMLSVSNVDQALLTVDSAGGLDYFPVESPISANSQASSVDGVLELDFDEGGVIDSIYFLKAQGKRTGIYVDYGESEALQQMGTATIVPTASEATVDTVSGQTLLLRDDKANEIVIFNYNADGSFTDYNNSYSVDGQQAAKLFTGNWSFADGVLTQTDHNTTKFNLLETATSVYYAKQGVEFESPVALSKAKPIDSTAFIGSYNVEIPTENTVNRELIISDNGQCTNSGFECSWTLTDEGVAEIRFAGDDTTLARAWQFANRSESYAFLITHDDPTDVEPGFMTRQ